MVASRVRIDDPELRALVLYAPLPWWLRLDVLPFTALYATIAGLALRRPAGDPLVALYGATAIFAHALTFLLGEWSVEVRAWLGFVPLRRLDAASVVVAKVLPAQALRPRLLCAVHHRIGDDPEDTVTADEDERGREVPLLWFSYQNLTFCLYDDLKAVNAGTATFRRLDYPTRHPLRAYRETRGHDSDVALARAWQKWGRNDFDIEVPPFAQLLKEQLVAPFFVFQFFCMLLWCLDEYVYYALMTLVMLVIFECTVVKQRQRNMEILNGMRRAPYPLFAFRSKRWTEVWSDKLVPGDIVSIAQRVSHHRPNHETGDEKYTVAPCDLLLLSGSCIVNESMLTGESTPLRKEAIVDGATDKSDDGQLQIDDGSSQEHTAHVVFGGTKILLQTSSKSRHRGISSPPDKGCLAYVLRTGFGTTQGSLMRTILHSSQRVTANNSEAMWFILLLLVFAVFAAGMVLFQGLQDPSRNRFKLGLHCIMIITSVVPPELPMELSLAVTNSLLALTKLNMFCTEPFRIPFAGRVDVCCFDKTGTLTSDELKMLGVAGINPIIKAVGKEKQKRRSELDLLAPERLPLDSELVLAGCHSLVFLNGQVMGDPLEVTALRNIQWNMVFGYGSSQEECRVEPSVMSENRGVIQSVGILHRFPFSSELKRMSTIVTIAKGHADEDDEFRLLTKGAPEVLKSMFANPPPFYDHAYQHFASKGCRVLALGYRKLSCGSDIAEIVRTTPRPEMEHGLTFAGFLVLSSPLKGDTKQIIDDLIKSQHEIVIITGDNALTACDVACQLQINSLRDRKTMVLVPVLVPVCSPDSNDSIEWRAIANMSGGENNQSERFIPDNVPSMLTKYDLCATGEALETLLKVEESKERGNSTAFERYMCKLEKLCCHVKVFSRTSPHQKEHIIMALNRAGKTTAMCGDGTNDVGALKRSHVGVSIVNNPEIENNERSLAAELAPCNGKSQNRIASRLAELQDEEELSGVVRLGDASIASPFTSKSPSIRVMKHLIRQGRCTLVTTIQMYKILGVNCLITAYYLSSLYIHGVKNGDQQLTVIGLSIAMFFLFLSRAKPARRLSSERPAPVVFCAPVLGSIIGQSLIHLAFLMAALSVADPYVDSTDPGMHPDGNFSPNVINTIMFLVSSVMQVNTFVANYKGHPFMQSFWSHQLLSRSVMFAYGVLTIATFEAFPGLNVMLELVQFPNHELQWTIFGLMVGDTVATLVFEAALGFATMGWFQGGN